MQLDFLLNENISDEFALTSKNRRIYSRQF